MSGLSDIDLSTLEVCPLCGGSPIDISTTNTHITLFDDNEPLNYNDVRLYAAWCSKCKGVLKDYITRLETMNAPNNKNEDNNKKFHNYSTLEHFLKVAGKDEFLNLFDKDLLDESIVDPYETKPPSIEELFSSEDTAKNFNSKGFKVNNKGLKEIPYGVLLFIAKMGSKSIGKTVPANNDYFYIDKQTYEAAQQALKLIKNKYYSVETGIQELSKSAEENVVMDKFAGIYSLKELLEKYANPYDLKEQMRQDELRKQKEQDAAVRAKQKRELNTDHVLDAQREQARQRQMQELNNYDANNRQQRQNEYNSESPWQKEPIYAEVSSDDILKIAISDEVTTPPLSDEEITQRHEEHNSLLKRNPELFKELLKVEGEISELGNSNLIMSLEFKDESEYTEEEILALEKLESLIYKAQEIYSRMI